MTHARAPKQVTLEELRQNGWSWSPAMYSRVTLPSTSVERLRDLLQPNHPFDKGTEPGSASYLRNSTHHLIRTKALQDHSYLIYPKGDAVVPVNPRAFEDPRLSDGDILISKDSNIGECAMADGDRWRNCMFSGGILRLNPTIDRFYLLAFLKHPLFKAQLRAMVPRGATIAHAKTLWLDCLVPFPSQQDADRVICFVSALMHALVDKERAIRDRADQIVAAIQRELESSQQNRTFRFAHPRLHEMKILGRLDAAIYDHECKSKLWLVENYVYGSRTPKEAGFRVIPGPSLEVKNIGTRLDSDTYRPNYYALILPTNISVSGTMNSVPYLGTAKELPLLRKGDVVFGEAGFHKGRSIVLLDDIEKCTTNAHGLYARRADADIEKSVFFRCIFDWYRSMRLIDLMAVGGSGGHFSPAYFHHLRIPRFPADKQQAIARLYHNPGEPPASVLTLDNFVDWHRQWNQNLGVWQLSREMRTLRRTLEDIQDAIIDGKTVAVPPAGPSIGVGPPCRETPAFFA